MLLLSNLRALPRWALLSLTMAGGWGLPAPVSAQEPAPPVQTPSAPTPAAGAASEAAGRPVTNAEIAEAIRASGLSESQVRARLSEAGFDPALADPFFSGMGGGAGAAGSAEFVQALAEAGFLSSATMEEESEDESVDRASRDRSSGGAGGVFGKDVFRRSASAFDPVTSGPVDPAYRLGIGDELQLVLTGEVELAYSLAVRRDGTVVIPQVGQIPLAGLTMEGARSLLRQRGGQSFSGIASGGTNLDLALTRIRTNAVFVIGEVEEPGAYQVSALATAFHALARAGGPRSNGSFRSIQVRRGGEVIQTIDLYRYLLEGDAQDDLRLEQGDVIFVPLNLRSVAVVGEVRRPRIFELKEGEGFSDLVRYAGGLTPLAASNRIQIDRVLPPEGRSPGVERIRLDVPLEGGRFPDPGVEILDRDILRVFRIGEVRRNTLEVAGAVFQPGEYEWSPGLTLGKALQRAEGLLPFAVRERIRIQRVVPERGRRELFVVPVDEADDSSFLLAEFDQIVVLDSRREFPDRPVTVDGNVRSGGAFEFLERETLAAVIDRAGGFDEGAVEVAVARRRLGLEYSDTTSIVRTFRVPEDFFPGGVGAAFEMEPSDRVSVRRAPGFRRQRFVSLQGEFDAPGVYAIREGEERILDLLDRAGGLTPVAFPASFRLSREGTPVAVDFAAALAGDERQNLPLRDGDVLEIGQNPGTVRVAGAVEFPALVSWQAGFTVRDYLERAGGLVPDAQLHRIYVRYASGEIARARRWARLFTTTPGVVPGATIVVPPPQERSGDGQLVQRSLSIASTVASLAIAWAAVNR